MTPKRLAIAGTGTEVGKTTLGIELARAVRARGLRVLALKPYETGFVDPSASDAARLAAAAGHALVTPLFAATAPVAPMRAAADLGHTLDPRDAARWVAEQEREGSPDLTLIETAGGLFSPLAPGSTNLDLLLALGNPPWLLVTRDRLGMLHDCLATLTAASVAGCSPVAVIVGARDAGAPASNCDDLRSCTPVPVLPAFDPAALLARLDASDP